MARTMTAAGVSVHPRGRAAHRAAIFLPPPAAAPFVWYRYLHEAGRYDGLGLLFATFLLLWPPLMVVLFLQPGCTIKALVPVKTRARRRAKVRRRRRAKVRHRRWRRRRAKVRRRGPDDRGKSARPRAWLKYAVMAGCRRRCVYCHVKATTATLEYDHYRPYAGGGLTSIFNVLMLCHRCNMIKCDYWVDDDGYVHYHPWPGYNDPVTAAMILHAELLHLRNPLHWIRAAWGIG